VGQVSVWYVVFLLSLLTPSMLLPHFQRMLFSKEMCGRKPRTFRCSDTLSDVRDHWIQNYFLVAFMSPGFVLIT